MPTNDRENRSLDMPGIGSDRGSISHWGLVTTCVIGAASFGIVPLLVWPAQFRDYVAEEATRLRALICWSRRNGFSAAAPSALNSALDCVQVRPVLSLLPTLFVVFVMAAFSIRLNHAGWTIDRVLGDTYRLGQRLAPIQSLRPPWRQWTAQQRIYWLWCSGLAAGYFLQWVQIAAHRADVARLIGQVNRVLHQQSLPPIQMSSRGCLHPLLIVAGIAFSHYGAWWAWPMLLAGAAGRRYTFWTSPGLRRELAARAAALMAAPPALAERLERCGMARCRSPLPPNARFCPRCGRRTEC